MKKEILQQALDALVYKGHGSKARTLKNQSAIAALESAIAQPEQPDVSDVTAHPLQPVVTDKLGTLRFKANAIVRFLSEGRLNELATMDFSAEDRMQLAQLIGYSVSGYGTLSYVTDESYEAASRALPATQVAPAQSAAQPEQPTPTQHTPLTTEDYSAIRGQLCESHPGVWLHHYGPAVEAEVLKRLAPNYVGAA